MNITPHQIISPKNLRQFLKDNKISLSQSMGQNFLTDRNILRKITDSAKIEENDAIVEIGPGLGFLTWYLLDKNTRVYAFEKDKRLYKHLNSFYSSNPNFTLIEGDFLKMNLDEILKNEKSFKVVSNLPYNITSPAFEKLLKNNKLQSMTVTIQKEVADRIVSPPACKSYSSFTIFCGFYSEPKILFNITPGSFYPPPSVNSSVIQLVSHKKPLEGLKEKIFFDIVKAVFTNRRKTLRNNFKKLTQLGLTDEKLDEIFKQSGIKDSERGENLSINQFKKIAEIVFENSKLS
ncbi:MAG: ribosomal RNA small subunit methyltransferase A [Spirochaetes bacterium]|nr:ribosomal RNA small subunit methyltransferase A [Spirochaetota bacterium]